MRLKKIAILFIIILLCICKANSQIEDSSSISFYFDHYAKYTTSNGQVKLSVFPQTSIILSNNSDSNKYQLNNIQDTFYIIHIDSLYGVTKNLDSIKVFIIYADIIRQLESSSYVFISIDNDSIHFNKKEKYYLSLTPFFEELLPSIYHGMCIPIVYRNIFIRKFPIGMIGDFYFCKKIVPLSIK